MSAPPPKVGCVTALQMERRWLGKSGERLMVERGGMGRERAEAASRRLLDRGATALVSWGIAGGLDPELESGTVVLVDAAQPPEGPQMTADSDWLRRLNARLDDRVATAVGSVFHTDEVVASAAHKAEIFSRWRSKIVDMESLGVAAVAVETGVPWIAVRVVTDTASMGLPTAVTAASDERGRLRTRAVARLLLTPWLWPALIRLTGSTAAAARSMREVRRIAAPDLAASDHDAR